MNAFRGFSILAVVTGVLAGCTSSERIPTPPAPQAALTPPAAAPSAPAFAGPVFDGSGVCTGTVSTTAASIAPGIGECELVRLKGKPPTDVLVGEGRSGREVQVLYNEPGAKELYFFVNNKLDRIVKT
ncbi:hypothetical protein [Methylobacterium haplocladii]|uniref:Lipoprotein n=1 Tax=Methylobacterium haplocladii TaxID=1176176 RepID=A0A512ITG4_9HYPH|nr:hypothetical protein [Methylobacterium haplocladii]GEP00993.1 hypothetical protein MHA02_33800 [Methylobacterium haplocladii]GJD84951.1 hypothetical protein HPGCJGGD_2834 [Methylobacterium haplocladii]GLS58339.1 hypothetical protein GCM10007887_09980 [Methylobacterium haplocladii]